MKNEKDNDIAISVEGVSKSFLIPHEKINTLRGVFVNLFSKKEYEILNVLQDISFDVKKGEVFGVIGPNGRGKSTLLKLIAGVYAQDSGEIITNGEVSPFLELGVGFNMELTGKENVFLNGIVLGLTEDEVREKFEEIISFAGIERFIDQKVKNYSSGMKARLAFSVALHAHKDILLLDEVFAVGDADFQKKCLEQFDQYRKENKTIVFASHNLDLIEKKCDRVLCIQEDGSVLVGKASEILRKNNTKNQNTENRKIPKLAEIVKPANNAILSIHVPKTAGTTFGEVLSSAYKGSFMYMYWHEDDKYWIPRTYEELRAGHKGDPSKIKTVAEICEIIIRENIRCVHGHVSLIYSDKIVDAFQNAGKKVYTVAFVRDPIERAISEVRHHKRVDANQDHDDLVKLTSDTMVRYLDKSLPNLTICHSERFEEDVKSLGYHWSGTIRNEGDLSIPVDRKLVEAFNKKDVAFYNDLQDKAK